MTIYVIYRDWGRGEGYGEPVAAFTDQDTAIAAATRLWGTRDKWELADIKLDEEP